MHPSTESPIFGSMPVAVSLSGVGARVATSVAKLCAGIEQLLVENLEAMPEDEAQRLLTTPEGAARSEK